MDNYQKLEQLVSKTGCSYEDGKAALEGCGWDMIDAVISLEKEGKLRKETVEQSSPETERSVEIVSEVAPVVTADNRKDQDGGDAGTAGSSAGGRTDEKEGAPKRKLSFWKRFKNIMTGNRMLVLRSSGQLIVDLPIWIPVAALIMFFWATLAAAVVAIIFGCHFHFEGEDLGKTNINSTMDKASDYAEKVRNDLAGKANGRQNTDN